MAPDEMGEGTAELEKYVNSGIYTFHHYFNFGTLLRTNIPWINRGLIKEDPPYKEFPFSYQTTETDPLVSQFYITGKNIRSVRLYVLGDNIWGITYAGGVSGEIRIVPMPNACIHLCCLANNSVRLAIDADEVYCVSADYGQLTKCDIEKLQKPSCECNILRYHNPEFNTYNYLKYNGVQNYWAPNIGTCYNDGRCFILPTLNKADPEPILINGSNIPRKQLLDHGFIVPDDYSFDSFWDTMTLKGTHIHWNSIVLKRTKVNSKHPASSEYVVSRDGQIVKAFNIIGESIEAVCIICGGNEIWRENYKDVYGLVRVVPFPDSGIFLTGLQYFEVKLIIYAKRIDSVHAEYGILTFKDIRKLEPHLKNWHSVTYPVGHPNKYYNYHGGMGGASMSNKPFREPAVSEEASSSTRPK